MSLRHVSLLVRMELTRRYRATLGDTRRLAVLVISGLFLLIPFGLVTLGAYYVGDGIASGDVDIPLWIVRAVGGGLVLVVAMTAVFRAIQTAAIPAHLDGLLLAASHREVVASVLVLEGISSGGIVLVPGLAATVAFGVGFGTVGAGLGAAVAILAAVALGTALGLALGFSVRLAIARSEFLARYKTGIGVLLFAGYFLAVTASDEDGANSAFEVLGNAVGESPLGWLGDLGVLGAGVGASPTLAGSALLLTVGGVIGGTVAVDRLASRLWYETAVEGTPDEPVSTGMSDLPYVSKPVGRIARKAWIRAWRSPIRLLFVLYPLFVLVEPIASAVRTGAVPTYLPAFVTLYGAWATGAAFTLNPLGDETDVLPLTLTTPVRGRTFMLGCCLAGVALGLPFTVLVGTATAVGAGLSPVVIGATAGLGAILTVGAALLATGIGTTFPRLEAVNVTRGRKAVVPSLFGFGVFSLCLTLLATPALLVQVPAARDDVVAATGMAVPTIVFAGLVVTGVLVAVAGVGSLSMAARTFDDYRLE